jgi:hypothetical protein
MSKELTKRFCEILDIEDADNPMVKQLTQNVIEGQIIMIDTKRHTILGLPSEEQEA